MFGLNLQLNHNVRTAPQVAQQESVFEKKGQVAAEIIDLIQDEICLDILRESQVRCLPGESVLPFAEGFLLYPDVDASPEGLDYVRALNCRGKEVFSCDSREWNQDPRGVLASISRVFNLQLAVA